MIELFKQYGVTLRSLTEQFDSDTEMGRFVLQMLGATAQLEREQIADNVRLSSLERSRQGKWNCAIMSSDIAGYATLSGLNASYATEVSKGIKLSEYVVPKE